jgi:hypothetical protein
LGGGGGDANHIGQPLGWWFGADVEGKPAWITCDALGLGIANRTFTVQIQCGDVGELFVGYMASYAAAMGVVQVNVTDRAGRVLRSELIDSRRALGHESTFQTHTLLHLGPGAHEVRIAAVPRPGENRTAEQAALTARAAAAMLMYAQHPEMATAKPKPADKHQCLAHNHHTDKFKLLYLACF